MRTTRRPHRLEIFAVVALATGLGLLFFGRVSNFRRGEMCQSNLKRVALAMFRYTRDYDETFPPAHKWAGVLQPYTKESFIFHCPSVTEFGYSLNAHLDGLSASRMTTPAFMPMVLESSTLQDSQSDAGESRLIEPRHPQGLGILFGDGHAEWRQQLPLIHSLETIE